MYRSIKLMFSLFLIILIVLSLACSKVLTPHSQIPISMNIVGPIDVRNEVSILNSQTKRLTLIHASGGFKSYANLQQWTDFIIDQLKTELEKRGVQVKADSDIAFKISVQDIKFYQGQFAVRTIIKVLVERSDIAWSRTYEGNCARFSSSIDCSVYRAVEAILGDRGFQKALSREYREKVEEEAASEEDIVEKLKQLKEMKERGLITEEEYQNKKKKILEEF